MATIFTRDWTAANGTDWADVGFSRVLGGAINALVISNQGGAGSSASERTYRATSGVLGLASYKARLELVWKNAAGADRIMGVWARLSADGANGYVAELGSNLDDPRLRIRRRSSGTWSTIVDWTDVPGVTGATLNAGATLLLRVENTDESTVNLKASVNGSVVIDANDTSVGRVQSGGTAGVQIGPNCVTDDVLADDLTVLDFEDEHASPGDLGAGLSLVIDGTYHSQGQVAALGIIIGQGRDSYEDVGAWTFRDRRHYYDPALKPGAWVSVVLNGTIIAAGRIRRTAQRLEPAQGNTYQLASLKQLASEIIVSHPDTQAGAIVYNPELDSDDYDPDLAGKTIGQSIAHLLDAVLEGDGGLKDMGLAPTTGAPAYVQAEIDAISLELPGLTASDNVLAAVEGLLSFTRYSLWIDPATRIWHFRSRMTAAIRDVDLADDHVTGELGIDPDRNATAVLIRGTKPEVTTEKIDTDLGLGIGWEGSLEATYDNDTRYKERGSGTVAAHGTSAGKAFIDVSGLAMVNHEWVGGAVKFSDPGQPIDGVEMTVESNTTSRLTFTTDWPTGPVVPRDTITTFVVEGNRHKDVFRRFKITDADKAIPAGACIDVRIFDGDQVWSTKAKVTSDPHAAGETEVTLDLPAVSLVNFAGSGPAPCDGGGVQMAERVEIEAPTYSKSSPLAPVKRVPAAGFHGTAYTLDSNLWDGGGKPGIGDPGIMRVHPIDLPGFTSLSEQGADMQALGDEMLEVLSPLARTAVLRIHGLDETWAGLNNRLTVSRTGGTTGFEGLTDLPVMAVEWDPEANTTTVYAGTLAVSGYDLGTMRHRYNERLRQKAESRWARKLEELFRCLSDAPKGAGEVGMQDPTPICAEQVKLEGGKSVKSALDTECAMPAGPPCAPACTDILCGTIATIGNAQTNAQNLMSLGPYKGAKAAEQMGALAKSLACLWSVVAGIGSSHDQELKKANQDLASVRTNLTNLVNCINAKVQELCDAITTLDTRVTNIQQCFNAALGTKVDGAGTPGNCNEPPAPCGVAADCSHDFTETVCEAPCVQPIPIVNIACE